MDETREKREALQSRVDSLYARIEVLAARYGTLIPEAMRKEIDQEVTRNYREIHRLNEEIEELKTKEELAAGRRESRIPVWAVGAAVSTAVLVMSVAAGSWPLAILGVIAAGWTLVDWGRSKSGPGKDIELWRP
ncbi:hypothetical protein [Streptomyces sp. 5-10]|uniref:hypothetical protein n=1 Tax=Streptomyces sp. 5-10 TaxID=878925 RepID=UPI00168BD523|nr:hypothetical protein [Streptomyces sp. 5-10]MBD3004863.1 hypothetical protein [Streptomyces sp. 5-10]